MKGLFGDMQLKPETAKEVEDCTTPDGLRRRLREYSYRGGEPMVKAIFDAADFRGLSGEDKMTWLAFEALKGLEYFKGLALKRAILEPTPPPIFYKPNAAKRKE